MNGREAEVSGRSLGLSGPSELQAVLLKASCGRVMRYTGTSQTLGCHKPKLRRRRSFMGRCRLSYPGERQEGYGTWEGSSGVCGVLPGCSTWAVSQPFCSMTSTRWSEEGSNHRHPQLTGPDGDKILSGHLAASQSLAAGGWVSVGCWQVPQLLTQTSSMTDHSPAHPALTPLLGLSTQSSPFTLLWREKRVLGF